MNDKIKHRMIGGAIMLMVMGLITPLLIKNSKRNLSVPNYPITTNATETKLVMQHPPELFTVPQVAKVSLDQPQVVMPRVIKASVIAAIPQYVFITTRYPKRVYEIKPHPKPKLATTAYVVQVASFSNIANAHTLQTKLTSQGYKVYLQTVKTASGEKLVKVMVGNCHKMSQAHLLQAKLAKEIKLKGMVVKEDRLPSNNYQTEI